MPFHPDDFKTLSTSSFFFHIINIFHVSNFWFEDTTLYSCISHESSSLGSGFHLQLALFPSSVFLSFPSQSWIHMRNYFTVSPITDRPSLLCYTLPSLSKVVCVATFRKKDVTTPWSSVGAEWRLIVGNKRKKNCISLWRPFLITITTHQSLEVSR